ncbi:MAG: carbohydrate kinase, partial [Imperialibacter sp.]
VFTEAFVNVTGVPVELYEGDGSVGAAVGAGLGAGVYADQKDAFKNMKRLRVVEPSKNIDYEPHYEKWLGILKSHLD